MRRFIYLILLIPFVVFAIGTSKGDSPQSQTATLTLKISNSVGITVNNDAEWDFTTVPNFPPDVFPQYYYPTTPASSPYQQLEYMVYGAAVGVLWEVIVSGDGDPNPACGILLGDIEFSVAGAESWTPFHTSATPDQIANGSGKTAGWVTLYQDYQVNITGDEVSTVGSTVTITYTIQTL